MEKTMALGELISISKGKKPIELSDEKKVGFQPYLTAAQLVHGDIKKWAKGGIEATSADVLISWDGTVGNVGWGLNGIVGSTIGILSPDIEKIQPAYLGRLLSTKKRLLNDTATGATIKHIRRNVLEKIEIPIISFSEQTNVISILDNMDKINHSINEAVLMQNTLINSIFLEMFGDYKYNKNNFEQTTLGKAGVLVQYGMSQNPPYRQTGTPIIRATNVSRGKISSDDLVFCDPNDVPNSKRIILSKDDIIVVRSGAYTGDVAKVGKKHEGSLAGYDLVLSPNESMTSEYLSHWLLSEFVQQTHFGRLKRRAGQPHLNKKQVEETPILLPPINLQRKFSNIINSIQKMPSAKILGEITLKSLIQEMFT